MFNGALIESNQELTNLMTNVEGNLTIEFRNKEPKGEKKQLVIEEKSRGMYYIIGEDQATEDGACEQLKHAAELDGCLYAIGMPDLHQGKGIPIGAVVMTNETVAYPQLVDNDIGCGMSFVETKLGTGKVNTNKASKIAQRIMSIDCGFDKTEVVKQMTKQPMEWAHWKVDPLPDLEDEYHYDNLGTVGGGNHFAEL